MRTTRDRLRHAIAFEVVGLALCIPLAVWVFDLRVLEAGPLTLGLSLIATGWNFTYNKAVDALMARHLGRLEKTWPERVWHALGFEFGLLVMTLPLIGWWLSVSLLDALIVDLGLIAFYVTYAFIYNWAYDRLFPPPPVMPLP
jgi:uncharacterized membrane protein